MRPTMAYSFAAMLFLSFSLIPLAMAGTTYTYTTIDYPGAVQTLPWGINDSGQIVGYYVDSSGMQHGFLRSGGTFTTIDHPAAATGLYGGTSALGISSNGQIVGDVYTCTIPNGYGCRHSYVLSGGLFTDLADAPNSMSGTTEASSINSNGQIVGYSLAPDFDTFHGFLFSNGVYTVIDQPGFVSTGMQGGINDSGEIAGHSAPCVGCATQGFLLVGDVFTAVNVPLPGVSATAATGISNAGDVDGFYWLNGNRHGFVLSGGTFTSIDYPGANWTQIYGESINSSKQVVGFYMAADGLVHGFLATPAPTYSVRLLYDSTKEVKSGATIPIKLQLCDGTGANVSSLNITLHAVGVAFVSSSVSGVVQDAGNANPDYDFRYDPTSAGYIFNLKTPGLGTGSYTVNFHAGNDATVYKAPFEVK